MVLLYAKVFNKSKESNILKVLRRASKEINISRQEALLTLKPPSAQGVACEIFKSDATTMTSASDDDQGIYKTLGGRVVCKQCTAGSKRSGQRCKAPAVSGFNVCRMHGARGGVKTEEGRAKLAYVNTVHGRETRQIRAERSKVMKQLRQLEHIGHELGFLVGPKTRGPKSKT